MENFAPGSTLQNGKYRIDAVLGKGGFGITYVGVHTMLRKKLAIKEFFPSQFCDRNTETNMLTAVSTSSNEAFMKFRRKFVKEAITLSQLSHPNIVSSVDVFEENNTAYYIMDYIDGRSLQDLTASGPIDINDALRYVRKIGDALSYIHSHQIMHLDVKPANIMVRNKDNEPILIDFGLAKNYSPDSENSTNTSTVGISKGYSPIEQYTGEIKEFSPKSDLYALAGTLYRMLTGKTPPEPTHLLAEGLPVLPANVPASVAEPLKKAMAVSRNQRYDTVADFLAALPTAVGAPAVHSPEPNPRPAIADQEETKIIGKDSEETRVLGKDNEETRVLGNDDEQTRMMPNGGVKTTFKGYRRPSRSRNRVSLSIGEVEDRKSWIKRDYNWLWLITTALTIIWAISCLSCTEWQDISIDPDEIGIVHSIDCDTFNIVCPQCCLTLCCLVVSWLLSKVKKTWTLIIQIPLVIFAFLCAMYGYGACEYQYIYLLGSITLIPFAVWALAIFFTLSRGRKWMKIIGIIIASILLISSIIQFFFWID